MFSYDDLTTPIIVGAPMAGGPTTPELVPEGNCLASLSVKHISWGFLCFPVKCIHLLNPSSRETLEVIHDDETSNNLEILIYETYS